MNNNTYHIFFGHLANPLKVEIISCLKQGDRCVNELSEVTRAEQSKLSHALAGLRSCNLVEFKRIGKKKVYSLNRETMVPMLKLIDNHAKKNCNGKCKFCSNKK